MTKAYLSVLLFSSLIYPIAWYVLYSQEIFYIIFGYIPLAVTATVSTAVAAVSSLVFMKAILGHEHTRFSGMTMRIGGAVIAGMLSPLLIWIVTSMVTGVWTPFGFGWWEIHWTPAFASSFAAYWLTNLLVGQATPV